MLARAHRLVKADDYRNTVRRGRRIGRTNTVFYIRRRDEVSPPRFGFIVAKNVGKAVVRNRVRRRLKAASLLALAGANPGTDIVIRALPGSAHAAWTTLQDEICGVVNGSVTTS